VQGYLWILGEIEFIRPVWKELAMCKAQYDAADFHEADAIGAPRVIR
jgi:hypothetical protein